MRCNRSTTQPVAHEVTARPFAITGPCSGGMGDVLRWSDLQPPGTDGEARFGGPNRAQRQGDEAGALPDTWTWMAMVARCTQLRVYDHLNQKTAIQFIDYVFEKLPFRVEVIQTDNGAEFQSAFHWHVLDRGDQHAYIKPATPPAQR